jgi:hypothetical protein
LDKRIGVYRQKKDIDGVNKAKAEKDALSLKNLLPTVVDTTVCSDTLSKGASASTRKSPTRKHSEVRSPGFSMARNLPMRSLP